MPITVRAFSEDWISAVKGFNRRLQAGGSSFRFPEHPVTSWLPKLPGREVYQDLFLAVEDRVVRGGFILKRQTFSIRGQAHRIAHLKLPISEGIVNKTYATLGLQLLRSALEEEPRLFCLGMGGLDKPLPRMLKGLRWTLLEVPFSFDVNRAYPFLRNIRPLRTGSFRRLALDLAAVSGLGWLGVRGTRVLQKWRRGGRPPAPYLHAAGEPLSGNFESWTDRLWERCAEHYSLCAVRDQNVLNLLYPAEDPRFLRLRWTSDGEVVGWTVLLDTTFQDHRQFGAMRVGSLVDGIALPPYVAAVVRGSARTLRQRGVDLLVSNQSHQDWHQALMRCGFLSGPSNFVLALSPALARMLDPLDEALPRLHFNRGDGDGPINL